MIVNLEFEAYMIDYYCEVFSCSVEELENIFKNVIATQSMLYDGIKKKQKEKKNA